MPDSLVISGDTIQQLWIDCLNSLATFALYLRFTVRDDSNDKGILISFFKAPFINQERPKVVIRDNFDTNVDRNTYCFVVYTLPHRITACEMFLFPEHLQTYVEYESTLHKHF